MASAAEIPVVTDVEALAGADGEAPTRPVSVDLAAVIYTSGSTGDPKGVTLTHANMTFAADSIIEYLEMEQSDIVLCVLPLSFDYGLYQLLMSMRLGATLVLEPNFAFPGRVVQLLEAEESLGCRAFRPSSRCCCRCAGSPIASCLTLRFLTNTGAALPEPTVEAIRRTFPNARLYSMYGLTECKRATYLPPDQLDGAPDLGRHPDSRAPRPGSRTRRATCSDPARSAS